MDSAKTGIGVSICILCYNQKTIINQIIEATFQQTHPAKEILVVDDGSSDGSAELIKGYAQVTLLEHEYNQGRTAARNTLLQAAHEDILVYLDGDTIPDPGLLQALLSEYQDSQVAAVGSYAIEQNVRTIADRWRERHGAFLTTQRVEDADAVFGAGFSCRRSVTLELGGFRLGGEEVDMCFRLRKAGYRIVYTPAARVYHLRTDSLSELFRTTYRWSFGGSVAKIRNNQEHLSVQFQGLFQTAFSRFFQDLFSEHDVALAFVNLLIIPSQARGLLDGLRFMRSGLPRWSQLPGL